MSEEELLMYCLSVFHQINLDKIDLTLKSGEKFDLIHEIKSTLYKKEIMQKTKKKAKKK